MDTTLQDPLVGQVLDGRYRIEARIAIGGMATVYRAVDTRLDRVLALKVMHPTLATDDAFVERFIREAKSVARLDHPNVVGVFDQGTDGTYVYLAMEYVAGCTLRDVLRERGALQPRIALDVAEPVLAALGAAHLAGLVHRDMKPENVLIGDDGRVKVADFGLVRAVDAATNTSTGAVLGTVSYLAPEQIEHGTADTRADVYACGVVLYEMLTGAKPHTGTTPAQVLYQQLHEDVPAPSRSVPGLAPALDDLVAEATARDPEQRPAGAVELLGLLRTARSGLTDAQLDVAPPRAKAGTLGAPVPRSGSGPDDRTSVIPRAAAARASATRRQPAPSPAADGAAADDELNRTSVLGPPLLAERPVNDDPPPQPVRRRPGGLRMPRRPVLTAVTALLLVFGVGLGIWYINSGQFTHVPAVLSMKQAEAEEKVRDAGLDVKIKHGFSDVVEKGRVISTHPESNARIRNTGTVTLTVSRGTEMAEVPNVAGMSLEDAKKKIEGAGLSLGKVTKRFSEETPRGDVLGSEPAAGTERRPDSAVAVTVSKGAPIDLPDVVGDALDDAESELRDAGLDVRIAEPVFSDEDKDTVALQNPPEGSRVAEGDTITLTPSKGKEMIEVPHVEGNHLDDAKRKLEDAGFKVGVNRFFFGDTVFDQSVDGGDEAPKGSKITLRVR
ncbi:Stk1 family PASTA domain-containing Ser/Thr kinase [Streptomyces sp. AC536]|uniref:Stk1 family PASTA domain-containing Ser/Thr kinase n=1 Tax=Streptomyces buecherae TaxID=2763006 RepID=UPI00164EBDA8|nr:Stk1 family PASTA domain-containing Ser/Thr kinase [Streptomyces buecherae]MBC3985825.1 Stk1 family PASTA domain-containing Ser/Thr kinase [Streptomyces buecherae]QNJ42930.1 Stk1 family PASTA domain-containing Ser/Thr kinase [Streptomyces buecherae]